MDDRRFGSAERAAFGGDSGARGRPIIEDDPTDYEHRHFVNLVAAAFLLTMAIAIVWTVKAMQEYENQRACFDSGRRDCVLLDVPQHAGIRAPARR